MDLSTSYGKLGSLQAEAGDTAAARASIHQALAFREGLPSTSPVDPYNTAKLYVLDGELSETGQPAAPRADRLTRPECLERAIAALRRAVAEGFTQVEVIRNDPDLAPLRSREDFQALLMDLPFPADPFTR
jgi:hypothetical protein